MFCKKESLDDKGAMGFCRHQQPKRTSKPSCFYIYQKFGVEEYWIVDPEAEIVEILILDETGKYNPGEEFSESLKSTRFPDLTIDLKGLFDKIRD